MKEPWAKGTKIISSDRKLVGYTSGGIRHCTLEGCRGLRVRTVWEAGNHTWPCTKGLFWNDEEKGWQIM